MVAGVLKIKEMIFLSQKMYWILNLALEAGGQARFIHEKYFYMNKIIKFHFLINFI